MIVGTNEQQVGSSTKSKIHMRSMMLVSAPKRSRQQERQSVEFGNNDEELVSDDEGNYPMVVLLTIANFEVKRILVYSGSAVEVLSWDAYQKMGLKEQTLSKGSPLYGFANHPAKVKGSITLLVTLGDGKHTTTEYGQFFMVDHPMVYNVIFRRPTMRMAKMVVVMFCMKIKFLMRIRARFLQSDQQTIRLCHMLSVKQAREQVMEGQSSQGAELASQVRKIKIFPTSRNRCSY